MNTGKEQELAIETAGLEVTLHGRTVLRDISLRVPRGQLVALIGPNGSGKTTLLRTLLGLQKPAAGTIRLLGEADLKSALRRIGYVPQRMALDPSFILSVREFLALRLRKTRHWFWQSRAATDRILEQELGDLGVKNLLDQPLAQLSGGQLQRVLIAFSLMTQPELLLLDEPTAGVDAPGEKTFYEVIAGIHAQRRLTVVLVSHDLSLVFRHAQWVYALNQVICCEGPPESVMNEESLRAAYGIHVSPYHHHHVH